MGCEEPTQNPAVWFELEEEWYSCPIKFIMDNTLDFVKEYDSLKSNMAVAGKYGEQSSKYYEAITIFENYVAKFTKEKQGVKEAN